MTHGAPCWRQTPLAQPSWKIQCSSILLGHLHFKNHHSPALLKIHNCMPNLHDYSLLVYLSLVVFAASGRHNIRLVLHTLSTEAYAGSENSQSPSQWNNGGAFALNSTYGLEDAEIFLASRDLSSPCPSLPICFRKYILKWSFKHQEVW